MSLGEPKRGGGQPIVILVPINIYFIHCTVANDHIYTNAPLSRPISEVKRVRARLVRTWGTSLESRGVVGTFNFFYPSRGSRDSWSVCPLFQLYLFCLLYRRVYYRCLLRVHSTYGILSVLIDRYII